MSELRSGLRTLGGLLVALGFVSWLALAGAFLYHQRLVRESPARPDAERSVEMRDHGRSFFVTPRASTLFHGLLFGGALGCASGFVLGGLLRRATAPRDRAGEQPSPPAGARS